MEKSPPNYYDLLGIDKSASTKDISRAFRRTAGPLHPDRNPGHQDEYKKLTTIFETLKDPDKKAVYDRTLLQKKDTYFIPEAPVPQKPEPTTSHAPVHEGHYPPPSKPEEDMPEGFKDSPFLTWAYNEADEDEMKFIRDHAKTIKGIRNLTKNIFGRKK